jgi:hypothetical protein
MMKKLFISGFITLILSSCGIISNFKSDEGISCRKFNKFIQKNWQYDEQERIYKISLDNMDFLIKHKTCLYALSEDEVIRILGEPSTKILGGFRFHLNVKCNQKPQKYCDMLWVGIDNNTKLVKDVRRSSYELKY